MIPGTTVERNDPMTDCPPTHAYNIMISEGGIKIPSTPELAIREPMKAGEYPLSCSLGAMMDPMHDNVAEELPVMAPKTPQEMMHLENI